MTIAVGLKLIPLGQGGKLREYYIRFEGSMYGVLHVDVEAHTASLVPLKDLDNIPVLFHPVVESQETNPWRTLARADDVGDQVYIMTEKGKAVELFFNAEEGGNEDGEDD